MSATASVHPGQTLLSWCLLRSMSRNAPERTFETLYTQQLHQPAFSKSQMKDPKNVYGNTHRQLGTLAKFWLHKHETNHAALKLQTNTNRVLLLARFKPWKFHEHLGHSHQVFQIIDRDTPLLLCVDYMSFFTWSKTGHNSCSLFFRAHSRSRSHEHRQWCGGRQV